MSSSPPSPLNGSNPFNLSFSLTNVEIGMLSFLNILFSLLGSLGNIFVCFAFLTYSKLRSTMNIFILSLACSDLLVCLVAQPMFVLSLIKRYQQEHVLNAFEDIRKGLTWVSLLASTGNLLGVTLDRYLAIINPLSYGYNHNVKPISGFCVALAWLIAICLGTSTSFSSKAKLIGQIYVFLAVICLIFPLYCRVLYIARKHQQHINASLTQTASFGVDNEPATPSPPRHRDHHKTTDGSALKTVGVISGVFVLGWFPLFILPFIYRSSSCDRHLVLALFQWVNTLALCSSAANPIVYSWPDRKFRESLQMVYKRWASKRFDA